LAAYEERLGIALNAEYASWETPLQEGDEVAFLPPVSGGKTPPLALLREPIEVGQVVASVAAPDCGAVVVFLGTVRNHSQGRRVRALEYEAYPEMALREMERIRQEIRQRWGLERVAIVHRLGHLEVGEVSVVIAVAAPHRAEAFEACRYAIERLKESVPIWKKEMGEEGEVWVEGPRPPSP